MKQYNVFVQHEQGAPVRKALEAMKGCRVVGVKSHGYTDVVVQVDTVDEVTAEHIQKVVWAALPLIECAVHEVPTE